MRENGGRHGSICDRDGAVGERRGDGSAAGVGGLHAEVPGRRWDKRSGAALDDEFAFGTNGDDGPEGCVAVSYTHLTLPTN